MVVMVSHRAYLGPDSEVTHGVPQASLRHPRPGPGSVLAVTQLLFISVHVDKQIPQVSGPGARRYSQS